MSRLATRVPVDLDDLPALRLLDGGTETQGHKTFVIDANTGARVPARIRPVRQEDAAQLREINSSYQLPGPGKDSPTVDLNTDGATIARIRPAKQEGPKHSIYVIVTDEAGGERIEGALSVTPDKYHGAKSLSVDGIDAAPWNMHGAKGREYSFVGMRLVEHAVRFSQDMGLDGRIHVYPRDNASSHFYDSLNFDGRGLIRGKDGIYYLPKKPVPEFLKRVLEMVSQS